MATSLTTVCFVFLVLETLVGMVANGSIVLINFVDWFRRRKLSPMDLILICLGLSRLFDQAVTIVGVTLLTLIKNTPSSTVNMLLTVWIFTNNLNVWLAACLSIFYLAKIAIFSHPVFLQFKKQLSILVPWMLLGSVVFSAALTIIVPSSWNSCFATCNLNISFPGNRSNAGTNMSQVCKVIWAAIATFYLLPVSLFLTSSILLINSLWKHMRRMQSNGTGTRDLNTQAHWSAIKALASFAVLYLVSFASAISRFTLTGRNLYAWSTLLYSVGAMYPTGHAIVLILVNPKLKQTWLRKLQHLKCASSVKFPEIFNPCQRRVGTD